MPKRSIYFPESIERILCIDDGSPESLSGRVSYMITLADVLSREQIPHLTEYEWGAIVYANAGAQHNYSMGVSHVLGGLWHNLFDYATEGDKKWGVDCVALARMMRSMPIGAQAAAFEVIKQFWARSGADNANVDKIDLLREIITIRDREVLKISA